VKNIYVDYATGEYQALGTLLTSFMLSVVKYVAPNTNSGLTTV
jgi:hypothetical protein